MNSAEEKLALINLPGGCNLEGSLFASCFLSLGKSEMREMLRSCGGEVAVMEGKGEARGDAQAKTRTAEEGDASGGDGHDRH